MFRAQITLTFTRLSGFYHDKSAKKSNRGPEASRKKVMVVKRNEIEKEERDVKRSER